MRTGLRNGAAAAALTITLAWTGGAWVTPAWADGITDGNAGREALLAGRLDEAIRLFSHAMAFGGLTAKNQAVTLNLRGNAYLEKGQIEVAMDDLNESLRLAETPDARFTRAKIYIAQFRLDDAIQDLNKAIAAGATAADVYALRGHVELYAGRMDAAIHDLDQSIKSAPDYGFAYRTRGHALMNLGQDDKAIADETKAIQLDPKDVEAHWLRGYAYRYRKKDLAKALADASAALQIDPSDSSNRTSRADIYEELGRTADAVADYDEWIRQNPKGPFGYWARGRLAVMQGKPAAAVSDLSKAVSLKPSDAYNVLWLHMARVRSGADDSAELATNAGKVNRSVWPGPLLDYLTGKADAPSVLAKANAAKGKTRTTQACEAQMTIGQDLLAKGRKAEAVQMLQSGAKTCDAGSRESRLIRTDLQRSGAAVPAAAQRPTPVSTTPVPSAKAQAASPVMKPAAAAAPPKAKGQQQQARADGDPVGLRGSLK